MGNGSSILRHHLPLLLLAASLAALPQAGASAANDRTGNTPEDVMVLGSRTFDQNCGKCHQPDGFGESGLYPSLHDPALLADREKLIRTMLHGRSGTGEGFGGSPQALMPALDYLTNAEIVAVIAFISSSWGAEKVVVSEQDVQAARARLPDER